MIVALLMGLFIMSSRIHIVAATVTIEADGSINPLGAPISTTDNITYTFTADINEPVVVERDNIIIDGASHTLYGGGTFSRGIDLTGRSNVTITGIEIKAFWDGISLWDSSDIKMYGNNITANKANGIHLIYSFNSKIFENNITTNDKGIYLYSSSNNTIYGNNITNHHNDIAVYITNSFNNTLYKNTMNNNGYDLEVHGHILSHFMHSIEVSNLIDKKPIYYIVNQTNLVTTPVTHPQIGYLALINCFNATVENLNLTSNGQGLLLGYTNNSRITGNSITNNYDGVWLYSSFGNTISQNNIALNNYYGVYLNGNSSNNSISGNNITDNGHCIELDEVSDNMISRNNITNSEYGIYSWKSSNCSIYENTLTNNDYGVWLESESSFPNNRFFHNNFVDNYQHVHIYIAGSYISGHNFWDNGFEGNYWSNYTGLDLDPDGIGDSSHVIGANNTDDYPLMGMFSDFNATSEYQIQTVCNSSISNFQFNGTAINFYVTGDNGTAGFCRICIPAALMNETFRVFVNGTEILPSPEPLPCSNSTHSYLYFNYSHSTQEVIIIPEFSSLIILPLFIITTLAAAMMFRRRRLIS